MMRLFVMVFSLLWHIHAISHESHGYKNILVDAGNSQVLSIPGIKRIAVGNSQIIKAKSIGSSELLIFGLSSGSTSLEVWNKNGKRISYRIDVIPAGLRMRYQEVSDMLAKVPNAKPSVVGNQVVIEGENLSESDRAKIRSILKRYPDVMDLTSQLGWDSMVLLDVQVLEIPATRMRELGVRWDPTARGGLHAGLAWEGSRNAAAGNLERGIETVKEGGGLGAVFGLNAFLSSRLHALTQAGEAVVLAQPQLLTRSGTTASFLAGGELPYSSVDKEGKSTTTFRKYGVSLNITPEVDRTDVVRSKIEIEVSSVDGSVTAPGGPALKIRKATSDFNVRSGQTLVIGGFISREKHADRQGLPGLSEIPVAGYLFGSQREQTRETELAIFVTPVVLDASHPSLMARVDAGKEIVDRAFPEPALLNQAIRTHRSNQPADSESWFSSQWSKDVHD
jgi:pilus assembly protein CpaC